ncbi:hypothetical protein [Streptomyces sp. NPDC020965]|uniref:hypothetical protein n=1 Tax=Streptomyces sp. NPDC020965 TaxID=3365105 RepID=UPI003796A874
MSLTLTLPAVGELTARYGPLRTLQNHRFNAEGDIRRRGSVSIVDEHRGAYAYALNGGRTLRTSMISSLSVPAVRVMSISLTEYTDPVRGGARYAVEHWTLLGERTVDHVVRIVADAEYERQVRAEITAPSLYLDATRLSGGLDAFYDVTDVL